MIRRYLGGLRAWWRQYVKCQHTHTFRAPIPQAMWFSGDDVRSRGQHMGLILVGCYMCGRVEVRDWQS